MPSSMTGFARQQATYAWGTLVWEIRSVNHRYLEPHFRLPELIRELEPDLRNQLRQSLSRGKIESSFTYQLNADSGEMSINKPLLEQLSHSLDQVAAQLANPAQVNTVELLRWPGLIAESKVDRDQFLKAALELYKQTLDNLIDHRLREGQELGQLIEQRLTSISEQVTQVRTRLPSIRQHQRQRLMDKLDSLKGELDQDRLEQEVVYLAQKTDVDEELDRLDTHVIEVRRTLKQKNSVGRRLDFLMQELNREANTLSSKSVVSETTQAAIELKVLIEQMREQIQNIE